MIYHCVPYTHYRTALFLNFNNRLLMFSRKLLRAVVFPLLLLASFVGLAQNRTVSGRVLDSAGRGIPGVSVSVKGQPSVGATTVDGGTYSLSVPANASTLVFSSVGYTAQEAGIP